MMQFFNNFSETTAKYLFLGLMLMVFYFFILRPKQQEEAAKEKFINGLKKGKKVITIGGIHGIIVDVSDEDIVLEIDKKGSKLRVNKKAIAQ